MERYGWLERSGWLECFGWLGYYYSHASLEGLNWKALIQGNTSVSVSVWFFFRSGGGGRVLSKTKLLTELFALFVWKCFMKRGGCLIPNFLRNFFVYVWTILGKEGGGYLIENFWGTFVLAFGYFSGEGGGLPDSKDEEEHFWFG